MKGRVRPWAEISPNERKKERSRRPSNGLGCYWFEGLVAVGYGGGGGEAEGKTKVVATRIAYIFIIFVITDIIFSKCYSNVTTYFNKGKCH